MKLLITGFEPFGNEKANPSWEVAKRIALVHPDGVEVYARRLPVVFNRVGDVLWEAVERFTPDVVLMLGVATKRSVISYERVAINIDESSKMDNEGKTYAGTPIRRDGPAAYFSTLPIKEMRDATLTAGLAAEISNSAGTYVCNHAMYECLYRIEQSGLATRAGFVHVPPVNGNGETGIDKLTEAIYIAIETLKKHEV